MTYVAHDCYLSEQARLGFVITQSVFKTKGGGEGFRGFCYKSGGKDWFLTPVSVDDFSTLQPFEGATNRTATFVVGKSRSHFKYPVPYTIWRKIRGEDISQDNSLQEVRSITTRDLFGAKPVNSDDRTSPWLTAPKEALAGIEKVLGHSDYKAYEGVNTGGLSSCYWIKILEKRMDGNLVIENLSDVGKIKLDVVQAQVEQDLVYPLLRGRDVSRWRAESSAHIIMANRTDKLGGIPESEMKRRWPKTYAYLNQFEGNKENPERGTLRGRALYKQYFRPTDPFYSMYNVGPYTLAKWKVMWPEVGHTVRAGVCGPQKVDSEKPALPDHTVVAVSCNSGEEAHYICALLNSAPAQSAASGYIVLHPSPHVMEHIGIRIFDKKNPAHRRLSDLSIACHTIVAKGDTKQVADPEAEIDKAAAKLWGITNEELKAIQEALAQTGKSKRAAQDDED
jgi:hypothetical protein